MTQRLCLVHYHEIGLKGKNRATFENQLVTNLHRALKPFDVANIGRISGYIVVEAATAPPTSWPRPSARCPASLA